VLLRILLFCLLAIIPDLSIEPTVSERDEDPEQGKRHIQGPQILSREWLIGAKPFDTLCPKSIGRFLSLQPETQRKIRELIYRACKDLAPLLGRDHLTYAELIGLTRQVYGSGLIPWSIPLAMVKKTVPPGVTVSEREPDLSRFENEEKLDVFLASAPEPTPEELERILKFMRDLLPQLRQQFVSAAKALPHSRGGAPTKLPSTDQQKEVIEEIKVLRVPGVKLNDVFKRVAQRHGVSASKIKQIWYRWAKQFHPGADTQ
jgi:hypothetical protein